ncbi:MAG: zinc ABC transporter substrate-binding protein [Simkania sp.]|nr:zinc ABC transporter substrate-binding protein [Simkania sp.]
MLRILKNIWPYALTLILLLAGCGKGIQKKERSPLEQWMVQNDKLKVLSTTAMIDDLVAKIGGENIDHLSLIIGEIDPHSYELVKGDDEKFIRADILFYNGLGLEHGASLRYRIDHHPNAVALGDVVCRLKPEEILYRGGQIDPHIWMDIALWSEIVDPIVEVLSKALPETAEVFAANGRALKNELLLIHKQITQQIKSVPAEKRFLVTSHDAFNYFTRAYLSKDNEEDWRERFKAPEGLAPEGQISPEDIRSVIDHLVQYQVTRVFPESNVSRDALRKIVEACRSRGLLVDIAEKPLHGDAMGPPGSITDSYIQMMQHNANVLEEAWR